MLYLQEMIVMEQTQANDYLVGLCVNFWIFTQNMAMIKCYCRSSKNLKK